MNISFLIFGDVVGRPGREGLAKQLPVWKEAYNPDVVIANGENLAHGHGITRSTAQDLFDAGVDVITTGNHIWNHKEATDMMQDPRSMVVRPYNYPSGVPGMGYVRIERGTVKILIANFIGRVFFAEDVDDPFRGFDAFEKEVGGFDSYGAVIVDFHVEATSESRAFGFYLDGRASVMYGTHTHVPTADAQILSHGTGYMSDVGMTGLYDSVIGFDKGIIIKRFLDQVPYRFEIGDGDVEVNGLYVEIDPATRKTVVIKPLREIVS
jgi:2',3'-cyclic-nucleotide 2'-phosphodiesterase